MNKKKLSILVAVIIVISSLITLVPTYDDIFDYANSIATILSCFCTFFTLILAISIYDKYGLSNKSHEETLNSVLKLYNQLFSLVITLNINEWEKTAKENNDKTTNCFAFLRCKDNISNLKTHISSSLNTPCYFSYAYLTAFQTITNFKYNIFIPDSIKKALQPFEFNCGGIFSDSDIYGACVFVTTNDKETQSISDKYCSFNDEVVTLETYLDNYQKLKKSIRDWLLKNGVDESIINIEL